LKGKILYILENENIQKKFSENSIATIKKEGSIDKMIEGFLGAIKYVSKQ